MSKGNLYLGCICLITILVSTIAPMPASAQSPTPTQCQVDVACANNQKENGFCPNDQPGQKDLTQVCIDPGEPTAPYEIHSKWNWDEVNGFSGGNTGDACTAATFVGGMLCDLYLRAILCENEDHSCDIRATEYSTLLKHRIAPSNRCRERYTRVRDLRICTSMIADSMSGLTIELQDFLRLS